VEKKPGAQHEAEDAPDAEEQIGEGDADEEDIDWLERLTADAPGLSVSLLDFVDGIKHHETRLSREAFDKRFSTYSDIFKVRKVPPQLPEKLFNRAILDRQMIAAYEIFKKGLDSDRFREKQEYIATELVRFNQLCEDLARPRDVALPRIFSEWEDIWVGSLRDLALSIRGQLQSANDRLVKVQEFCRRGRTEIESYLLWWGLESIQKEIDGSEPPNVADALLAVYAYASLLLAYQVGGSVDTVTRRVYRAKRSDEAVAMLSMMLAQLSK